MIEMHPFGNFVPQNTQYLFLGSFTGRRPLENEKDSDYDWFFGTKRNQFWTIMEGVYNLKLQNKQEKQRLFKKIGLAITDIILSCERKEGSNLDENLTNITFNSPAIVNIIKENKIKTIFFSSRFAHSLFRKQFKRIIQNHPEIKLITLPSPSPRYAAVSKSEKINIYKKLLPQIN